ncbi:hypothetical protein C7S18_19835 [Ahniella affigens]|uniref:Ester cyclase n=2 Tax=Ahniella affigens TaxID=2021234 RepID=A0A2P1PWP9_9GAMM|nr:hypothetical protein C7S18_19835 [Ahniella affigens]
MKTQSRWSHTLKRMLATCLAILGIGGMPCPGSASDHILEQNKALVRQVYEQGLSRGEFKVPYTSDFIGHGGNRTFDHAAGLAEAKGFRTAFPDLEARVDLILAEGDLVSARWTATGTNTGAAMGIPATGKRVQISGTAVFRIQDGAIAEEWTSGDNLGLMRQLGLLPAALTTPSPKEAAQR